MKLVAPLLAATLLLPSPQPSSPMATAATEFLASLQPELRERAVLAFGSEHRGEWAYTPGPRKGVSWGDLNQGQRAAAHKLLEAALDKPGAEKIEAIRQLELTLREMEGGNQGRDPERYWFMFFGEPSDDKPWTWRYEGHHVSLSFSSLSGTLVTSTPQFLGTNPAEGRDTRLSVTSSVGRRILASEQDLGFELVRSLSDSQRKEALRATTAPADIVTSNARKASIEGRAGLPYGKLDKAQQAMLRRLVAVHAEVQSQAEQKRRLEEVERLGYDKLLFVWMGPVERRARHYYRIQGDRFVIEFDCTQDDGNHVHTVWRRLDGDFPADPLEDHYRYGHHAHPHE